MPKNILQDVVPRGGRRSIHDVPLSRPGGSSSSGQVSYDRDENLPDESVSEVRYVHTEEETLDWRGEKPGGPSKWLIWVIGIVSVGALVVVLGNFFSGATVTITPKSRVISVNAMLTAKPNAQTGELSYTPFSLAREAGAVVAADGERVVETRASGKIIVYNNYSSATQRLVKNTRFETADGLIYKIADSITVPGRHVVAGKTVPGSIETVVYAESPGAEYNIGLTDFTIPGFKSNAERFSHFYGRSKTAMTGGSVGTQKIASEQKMSAAKSKLESDLTASLVAEARKQLPADSLFYDGAYRISFEPVVSAAEVAKDSVTLRERAKFSAYFFKRTDLARAIAETSLDNFDDAPVLAENDSGLSFKLVSRNNLSATSVGPIQFSLKGDTTIVWQVDQNKLATSLAGKDKNNLGVIASADSAILKASAVIRPFWNGTFPKPAGKIKFDLILPPPQPASSATSAGY